MCNNPLFILFWHRLNVSFLFFFFMASRKAPQESWLTTASPPQPIPMNQNQNRMRKTLSWTLNLMLTHKLSVVLMKTRRRIEKMVSFLRMSS